MNVFLLSNTPAIPYSKSSWLNEKNQSVKYGLKQTGIKIVQNRFEILNER